MDRRLYSRFDIQREFSGVENEGVLESGFLMDDYPLLCHGILRESDE
jgi:hypothetical protein